MDRKSYQRKPNGESEKLPDLPSTSDREFWSGKTETVVLNRPDHTHSLVQVSGVEAQCLCGWGILLDYEDEIKEGHLYRRGKLII